MLLPGLDGTGRLFGPLLDSLPADIKTKVVSYPAAEPLALPELAGIVARQLAPGKPVLLAESFSGLVVLALLAQAATRVGGVIFVGAFAEPPRPFLLRFAPLVARSGALLRSAPSFLLRQYCVGSDASAADLRMVRQALGAVSPQVLAQRLALVAARHAFGKMPAGLPSYYIRPSHDRLVPSSAVDWFRQRFAGCEIVEMEGPHFVLQARPRQTAEVIARIVRSLHVR